jgi:predicted membrane metal-binding protein
MLTSLLALGISQGTVFSILIALLIFVIAIWAIGLLPLPANAPPIKWVLYVIAAVILVFYLLRYV